MCIYSKIGKHSFMASQQTCFLYFDMFWSLCPMNRFTDYVCMFVWTFILNRWILTCCQLHLYRLFQFFFPHFFFFISIRRNIHFLPFTPDWYLNRMIVFLCIPFISQKNISRIYNIRTIHWQFAIRDLIKSEFNVSLFNVHYI